MVMTIVSNILATTKGMTTNLICCKYINKCHISKQICIYFSPIQFLTSGAGSKAWRGDVKNLSHENLKFFYDGQGFMSLQFTDSDMEITFYDVYGEVLHRWTTSNQLLSDM